MHPMNITGTHFNYCFICHRKLWLFSNSIRMEHTSDLVYQGKLIHETSYPSRSERFSEIEIGGIKLDYFDRKNRVVHEIKKSDKREEAHRWQLKYYLFILEKYGIENPTGILEYPKLRSTEEISLTEADRTQIIEIIDQIKLIAGREECPPKLPVTGCRNCSYFDFCWSGEE
jgi:CRISPR-associated exonuclease Cas4